MDWIRDNLWATWAIGGVVLLVVELLTLDLIFLMLAVACFLAMVAALAGLPEVAQVLVALVSAVALLLLLRPGLLRRLHGGEDLKVGHEALLGRSARTLTEIGVDAPGRIKLGGEEWTARPLDEAVVIPAGQTVEVAEIRGATAYVRPAPALPQPDSQEL